MEGVRQEGSSAVKDDNPGLGICTNINARGICQVNGTIEKE